MAEVLINGYFHCRADINGIERYAHEITKRLDLLCVPGEIALLIPRDAAPPPYKNIEVIRYGKTGRHLLWQLCTTQFFLLTRGRRYTVLEFGNVCLPLAPGIVFLHDIYCKMFPEDFTTPRDKLARLYNCWQYRLIARRAKRIVTVSYFSRNQIARTYHVNPENISVIYSSWFHFKTIEPDYSIVRQFPVLSKPFFFSLGSLSKRKNIRWIIEYALKHPDDLFALSGNVAPTSKAEGLSAGKPPNVLLLGYLDDSKVKALMETCKAFILPSYYEGFGLTPLEALSCGAQIIVADAASLPEIYGKTAHYIDPYAIDVDLEELLYQPVEKPDDILAKYSYDTAAEQVYALIKEHLSLSKRPV
ncbi:MAG: glycosyltransferase family 4 protein [Spirochaetaceae bacterium]|jgi:glycosyltransferase involved in cell wall biosynthesis|nr:glycosyltransferase family 4 protein [Spirochaetaceae bacterium]